MHRRKAANRLLVSIAIVLVGGIAACGDDDTGAAGVPGNGVDRAFVAQMIPHHESAVDMAQIAQQRTRRKPIRELADAIVRTQKAVIPHHQGAIHMARAELDRGENADLKRLAEAIIEAQSKEIDDMNNWRVDWYGGLSPAGGVPAEEEHSQHG